MFPNSFFHHFFLMMTIRVDPADADQSDHVSKLSVSGSQLNPPCRTSRATRIPVLLMPCLTFSWRAGFSPLIDSRQTLRTLSRCRFATHHFYSLQITFPLRKSIDSNSSNTGQKILTSLTKRLCLSDTSNPSATCS